MCEIDPETDKVRRIFKNPRRALDFSMDKPELVREYPRAYAIKEIRVQVFARADEKCEYCGRPITWETGELHEENPRGKGGEYSLENSKAICQKCHREDERGHANRRLHWGGTNGLETGTNQTS